MMQYFAFFKTKYLEYEICSKARPRLLTILHVSTAFTFGHY